MTLEQHRPLVPGSRTGEAFALRAGQVFDGYQACGPGTVVVSAGRVVEVTRAVVPGAQDLGDDVTLLPGLIDSHLHFALDASSDVVGGMGCDDDALLERMRQAALDVLRAGITTARDLGDRGHLAVRLAAELATGPAPGPTVLAAGPPLTSPGGHCHFLGGEVDSVESMLRAVEERAAQGCHTVKVMVSGGNITPGSSPLDSQFLAPALREVVAEAHRLGLLTAAHVHAAASAREALDAGFDSMEHASLMTPEGVDDDPALLRRIVDSGIVVGPTPGALPGPPPPPHVASRLEQIKRNFVTLHAMGARMVLSSDGGATAGKRHDVLPRGVADVVGAGIGASDALRMVTSHAAEALRLGGRKGALVPGADADLLAVRGDPTRDVSALQAVVAVYVAGRSVELSRR